MAVPLIGVYFPIWHLVQLVLPLTAVYSPGVQREHVLLLPMDYAEYEPLAQGVHADMELIPMRLLNVPAAQLPHMLAPAMLENVPLGHGIGVPVFE